MSTPAPTVYDTARRAAALGLSFAQMKALDWMAAQHPPVFSSEYRKAGITTKTMSSLVRRKLVSFGADVRGPLWFVTHEGRDAITKTSEEQQP